MIFIPHLAAGFLIGALFDNIFVIGTISIISHFILDAVPHSDFHITLKKGKSRFMQALSQVFNLKGWLFYAVIIHAAYVLAMLFIISGRENYANIIAGGFFAVLPDLYEWVRMYLRLPSCHFFRQKEIGWKHGVIVQGIVSAAFIVWFFLF